MDHDKIIILKAFKHSESNLIIYGLNTRGLKLKLIAPSALVSKKRFGGGVLQPTHYVQVTYKASRLDDGLSTLTEASLIEGFEKIRENYERLQVAFYFITLIDKVALEGESHSHTLFDLLGHGLKLLETTSSLELFKLHFELRFLHLQGVLENTPHIKDFIKTPMARHTQLPPINKETLSEAMIISRHNLYHYIGI